MEKAASRYAAGEGIRECKICSPEKRNLSLELRLEKIYIVLVKSLVMLIPTILKYVEVKKE
jgi:hypothetical protein